MKKQVLILFAVVFAFFLAGCASATPIDFLIPTLKPSVASEEYLGHLKPQKNVNFFYHSLADTKLEKALVPVRRMELEGLHAAAKGELAIIDKMGTATSNGVWWAITGLLGAGGLMLPRPQEKHLIAKAKAEEPN